jgi:hypothetical protein
LGLCMLVYYMFMIMLYFIYCLLLFIMEDRSWLRARAILFKQRLIFSSCLHHLFGYVVFCTLKLPNGF